MKICAEGPEVVIRMSVEEAKAVEVDHGEIALIVPVEDSVSALQEFSAAARGAKAGMGAGEYLRAERFDRRVEEGQIDAARLAFETDKARARKDYGFTTEPERTADRCPCCFESGHTVGAVDDTYECFNDVCPVFRFRGDSPLPGGPAPPAEGAEPSFADAAQEVAHRMYPDREGRVEGVDR